jgi:hypothetical protein
MGVAGFDSKFGHKVQARREKYATLLNQCIQQ